jgi:hypothetical protein
MSKLKEVEVTASARAVEVISNLYEAINQRRLGKLLDQLHDRIEFHPLPLTARRKCHGLADVESWWTEVEQSAIEFRIEIEEMEGSGDGSVLAAGRIETGELKRSFVGLHEVRNGRVIAMHHYFSDLATVRRLGLADEER